MSRYIDADELKEKIENTAFLKLDETEVVEQFIDEAPTIEPKQGEWNRLDIYTFHCKLCGTTFIVLQGRDSMNFCPNCGADMREREGE